jgi:hypothetical protein
MDQFGVAPGGGGGQGPFAHLAVGHGGQIDHAPGRRFPVVVVEVGAADDFRGQHALDEVLEPAPLIDPVVGLGPDAELLDVVEVDGGGSVGNRAGLIGHGLDVGHCLGGRGEGQAVAQGLGNGEQVQAAAVLLGGVEAVELVPLAAGAEKVVVVHHHVADAGIGQGRHHGGFPHSLSEPGALGTLQEVLLQTVGHGGQLAHAVPVGNHRQHRFHVAGAEEFHLAPLGHLAQQGHVIRVMGHQPFQQPAGRMQGETEIRVFVDGFQERLVATLVGVFHDFREVADGLVSVDAEEEGNGFGHGYLIQGKGQGARGKGQGARGKGQGARGKGQGASKV